MQLLKTDKARAELQGGSRTLGQRERTMLILADGKNTLQTIDHLFNGQAQQLARQLIDTGYLVGLDLSRPITLREPLAPARHEVRAPASSQEATRKTEAGSKLKPPAESAPTLTATVEPAPPVAADNFEGKRSLATTRMFLFDICERMFVRRDPARAEAFREALRNAKDRESMLAAARDMISAVEEIAGHERADSISERIAMLLPPEG
ncbi:hypothetical protein [Rhodoferax bucti]|uniref:hypothetical protein n=1 Tax=Rhodoferax bucti TaxID=2576305 RepID=UPI001108D80A|nr:hypothetical protein [Rhodoferax bucti]